MRTGILLLLLLLASTAIASPKLVDYETHGVALQLPATWVVSQKPGVTLITPPKKGRGIQVVEADAALTKQFVADVAKAAEITGASIQETERSGAQAFAVHGKIKGADVDMLAVENAAKHAVIITSFVAGDADEAVRDANLALLTSVRPAGSLLVFTQSPAKKGGYPPDVVKQFEAISKALGGSFRFPRTLTVRVQDCGVVNAFYNGARHDISLCHELWDDVYALFDKSGLSPEQVKKLTAGTVMFAFFHEFGHALVGEFGLPITGKGEDAADEIATIILGQAKQFGRDSALAGAAWFGVMSAAPDHKNLFWDEHSFDEQRAITIACLLYGSDQDGYQKIMANLKIPAPRQARCVRDYKDRYKAWNTLLAPYAHSKTK